MVMFLLVSKEPGNILDYVNTYMWTKLYTETITVGGPMGAKDCVEAINDYALLKKSFSSQTHDVVLIKDNLWLSAGLLNKDVKNDSLSKEDRIFKAHGLIVLEDLIEKEIPNWDLVFYKPSNDDVDDYLEELYQKLRDKQLTIQGPYIKLSDDEDEATDRMVAEISSYLGLDDE